MSFLLVFGQTAPVLANPTGGQVVSGSATIGGSGSTVTINQSTAAAIINWQQFSINSGELTKFLVPNSASATLNRVLGANNPSLIYGTLQSNGIVYLVNPSGIVVGPNGRIDTAGFIGSTLDVSDDQFLKGNLNFMGTSDAAVDNQGVIHASSGDVYLIAAQVNNSGTISAPQGTAGLAAANNVLYQPAGDQHLFIQSNPTGTTRAVGVTNTGTVRAATVELAAAGGNAYALAINNSGAVVASGYKKVNGQVFLTSDGGNITNAGSITAHNPDASGGTITMNGTGDSATPSGTVINSGTLNASATAAGADGGSITLKSAGGAAVHTGQILAQGGTGGVGGNVDVSGSSLILTGSVNLTAPGGTTGNLLLDPATLTVQSGTGNLSNGSFTESGGIYENNDSGVTTGADTVAASVVDGLLSGANVTLDATSGVTINSAISWNAATTLTLQTNNSTSAPIAIGAAITAPSGGLTIDAGGSTDAVSATAAIDVASFTLQNGNWGQLSSTLPGFTASQNFTLASGATFLRATSGLGTTGSPYLITDVYGLQGINTMLGDSFKLANNINAAGTQTWNNGAGFVPIGNGSTTYTGNFNGGGFAISNLTINQPGTGNYTGLFGVAAGSALIENVGLINAQVEGYQEVGALVGYLDSTTASIVDAYSTGNVQGTEFVGGLAGSSLGEITGSYSSASVTGGQDVGGLVGLESYGTIDETYSTGPVFGSEDVGGLVGGLQSGGPTAYINDSYSTGAVHGGSGGDIGGLLGYNSGGSVNYSFWDTGTSGQSSGIGGGSGSYNDNYGLTTPDLMNYGTYANGNHSSAGAVEVVGSTGVSTPQAAGYTGITLGSTWAISDSSIGADWAIINGQTRPILTTELGQATISGVVNTAHQLQLIYFAPNINYTLGQDIDASGTQNPSDVWGSTGFVPIGLNGTDPFTATFSGANYQINDLYINQPAQDDVALFGSLGSSALVENLGLTNVQVTGSETVGGLVGYSDGGQVNYSYTTGSVSGYEAVGGLVGFSAGGIGIRNSYSTASVFGTGGGGNSSDIGGLIGFNEAPLSSSYAGGTVIGGNYVGGLVGQNQSGYTISDTYATGQVIGSSSTVGGLVGYNGGTITDSYSSATVLGTSKVGGFVGDNAGSISDSLWDTVTSSQTVGIGYGTQTGATGYTTAALMEESTYANAGWNNIGTSLSDTWVIFNGQTRPLLSSEHSTTIANAHQLQLIGLNATTLDAPYTLANNIDATGTENPSDIWGTSSTSGAGFVPIGQSSPYFTGSLNGQGYVINGLYIDATSGNVGLIGYMQSGTIENIGLANVNITGGGFVGGLVGTENSGLIVNAYSTGSVTGNAISVGGLVGNNYGGEIENSYSGGTVTGNSDVGGLVGYNSGTIDNAYTTAAVAANGTSPAYIGGLVGWNATGGVITDTYSSGAITPNSAVQVGGFAGYNNGTINSSFWDIDSVSGGASTGVAAGSSSGVTGDDSGTLLSIGTYDGSAGWNIGTSLSDTWVIFNGYTRPFLSMEYGTTINNAHQLQLIGLNSATLGANYSLANNIDATGTQNASEIWGQIGALGIGFVPIGQGTPYFTGSLNGHGYAINGLYINATSLENVGLFGVTADGAQLENIGLTDVNVLGGDSVGALVGNPQNSILTNDYSTGTITLNDSGNWAGGLAGYSDDSLITDSYSSASVDAGAGTGSVGGLVGSNLDHGVISNSYSAGLVVAGNASYQVGGLVGTDYNNALIENSYSLSDVRVQGSGNAIGGLVGVNNGTSTILNCYASGLITLGGGSTDVGGLVGQNGGDGPGTIENSFWDWFSTGTSVGIGSAANDGSVYSNIFGLVTADLQTLATYAGDNTSTIGSVYRYNSSGVESTAASGGSIAFTPGWNIGTGTSLSDTWVIFSGYTRPLLSMEYSTTVDNAHQLELIGLNATTLEANYTQGADIDASGTQSVPEIWGEEGGFLPIGYYTSGTFEGFYNGAGYTINDLYIDRPALSNMGLFSQLNPGSVVLNVGLTQVSVDGSSDVGGLVGSAENGTIIANSYASGSVGGVTDVGGLAGGDEGLVQSSYTTGNVNGSIDVGGLIGDTGDSDSIVYGSYSTATVGGGSYVGGLIGESDGLVELSEASGPVNGNSAGGDLGGLVGINNGTLLETYGAGAVTAADSGQVGGLAGDNEGTIDASYSVGAVSGEYEVGGLAGLNDGPVETTYAAGAVTGVGADVGGLLGANSGGSVENSYWAQDTGLNTGLFGIGSSASNTGAVPETISNLETLLTFQPQGSGLPNWDFTSTWYLPAGNTPQLYGLAETTAPTAGGGSGDDLLSGTVYEDNAQTDVPNGQQIDLVVGGVVVDTYDVVSSGAYSFSVPASDLQSGVLVVDPNLSYPGNSYYHASSPASSITGIDVWGYALRVYGDTASNGALATAAGSLGSGGGIVYSYNSSTHALSAPNANMYILSGNTYTLDGNIVAGGDFVAESGSSMTGSTAVTVEGYDVLIQGTFNDTAALTFQASSQDVVLSGVGSIGTPATANGLTLTAAGSVQVQSSTIATGGGDFDAYGYGDASTGYLDGVDVLGSTIDAQGGSIYLSGQAGYVNQGTPGNQAGIGVYIQESTLETSSEAEAQAATPITTGNLTIIGNGSLAITGTPNYVYNDLNGVLIDRSVVITENGLLSITGTVTNGEVEAPSGNNGDIYGVLLQEGTQVQALGPTGAVEIIGNTSGSENLSAQGDNIGVLIDGYDFTNAADDTTAVFSAGQGMVTVNSTAYQGIYIQGTGGEVTSPVNVTDGSGNSADGVNLTQGATVSTQVIAFDGNEYGSDVTIIGQGGNNNYANGVLSGSANGVDLTTSKNGPVQVLAGVDGNITITGTGGSSPSDAVGVLIAGTNGNSTTVETENGSITITGTGDTDVTGYTGNGILAGTDVPNYGIAIADDAFVETGNGDSQTGSITLTGYGGANSFDVGIEQLPSGSFDNGTSATPTVIAGGAFNVDALDSNAQGIYLNADVTAGSVQLGDGTTGDVTPSSITSGPLEIENSMITVTTGDFDAFGEGTDFVAASLATLSGISIDRNNGSGFTSPSETTINAEEGSINLTGEASFNDVLAAGSSGHDLVAGEGVFMQYATLEAPNAGNPGGISITGDATAGDSDGYYEVQNSLQGVDINTSSITTGNGLIAITGTVNQGLAYNTAAATSAGFGGGNGVVGVLIVDGGVSTPTTTLIEDTTAEGDGAVYINGSTDGSISDATDTSGNGHHNIGVLITDNATTISSMGDGLAFTDYNGDTYNGIYIQGAAGNVQNNQLVSGSASDDAGVKIKGGATVEGPTGSPADITILGSADGNSTLVAGAQVGSAVGVLITSDGGGAANANGNTLVSTDSGDIIIDGEGGQSPNAGIGVAVAGKNVSTPTPTSATTTISSTSGSISIMGIAGEETGTSGYDGNNAFLANFGVLVADKATVETGGSGTIVLTGSGLGPNTAGVSVQELNSAFDPAPSKPSLITGSDGSVSIYSLSDTDVVLDEASVNTGELYLQADPISGLADSSTGGVYLSGSTITLTGQDDNSYSLLAFGDGTTDQPIIDYSETHGGPYAYHPVGVLVANTTINATTGAGTISLTGQGEVINVGNSDYPAYYAGTGVSIQSSTLETALGGEIDITGHGGVNQTVNGNLSGVVITNYGVIQGFTGTELAAYSGSTLSTVNGIINITGDVTQGTALNTTAGSGNGAIGILIDDGSTVEASGAGTGQGTGGAVYLGGDVSEAATDATANVANNHDANGVVISGVGTIVSSAGDNFAFTDGNGVTHYGVYITGNGGTVNNNQEAADNTGAASASGVVIANGGEVEGLNSADVTLVGQGGTNYTIFNPDEGEYGAYEVLGSAVGVSILSNSSTAASGSAKVTSDLGTISISGSGGASDNSGIGVLVAAFATGNTSANVAQVSSTTGAILIDGIGNSTTGNTQNTGPGDSADYDGVVYGHNNGISIIGAADLSTGSAGGITLHGVGAQSGLQNFGVTIDQYGQYAGPQISAPSGDLTVDTTIASNDSGDIYIAYTSLATAGAAPINTDGVSLTANGGVSLLNTYVKTNGHAFGATGDTGLSYDLDGVDILNSTVNASGTSIGGTITLNGTAGTSGSSVGYAGVYIGDDEDGPAILMTNFAGGISITGVGSTTATDATHDLTGVTIVDGSQIIADNGAINIKGTVADGTTTGNVIGVEVESGANVIEAGYNGTTLNGTGSITITGNDTATYPATTVSYAGTSSYGVLLDGATVTAFDAPLTGPSGISITGTAGSLANEVNDSAADGLEINGGTTITTAGTTLNPGNAPIALTGYGGVDVNTDPNQGSRAYGVYLVGGDTTTSVTSAGGEIQIQGSGGISPIGSGGIEANGNGVLVEIKSTSGQITLQGTIADGASSDDPTPSYYYQGVGLYETNVQSTSGSIGITGTIGDNIEGSQITAASLADSSVGTTSGAISIYGYVNPEGSLSNGPVADLYYIPPVHTPPYNSITDPTINGVVVYDSTVEATSSAGNYGSILIEGDAAESTASFSNYGVEIYGNSTVSTAGAVSTPGIQITGYAGTVANPVDSETGGLATGILVQNGAIKDTGAAPVTLEGYGGIDTETSATFSESSGVFVVNTGGTASMVISTGTGELSITGEGENSNYEVGGVTIEAGGGPAAEVTSTSGLIDIDGYNNTSQLPSVSDELFGVVLKGAQVTTAGEIDLEGLATTGTAGNRVFGVRVSEGSTVNATGAGGYVSVIGDTSGYTTETSGATSDGINAGVIVEGVGSSISSAGASGLSITGYAGPIAGSSSVTSVVVDSGGTGDDVGYAPSTDGVMIGDRGNVTALGASPMFITGTGGANTSGAADSSSAGIAILSPILSPTQTTGILAGTGTVTLEGYLGSSDNSSLYAILMGGASNLGSVVAGSYGLINFFSTGNEDSSLNGGDINLNGVDASSVTIDTAGAVTQDGLLSSAAKTPITTSVLSITEAAAVTLANAGNAIATLGGIFHSGALEIITDPGLVLDGVISGNAPVTLEETGGNITFDPAGQITAGPGNNVIIAAGTDAANSHYLINYAGANAITGGANYAIFSSDPSSDIYNGLTFNQPDVFNATFSTTGLTYNTAYYYAAQGATGPNAPQSPSSPGTGSDNGGNNTQSQLTTPPSVNPQTPPSNPPGTPSDNPGSDNGNGNGNSNQTGNNSGLANSSGSSGDVGSGDTAQLNDGQLNNVSNPAAASALNQALGAVVLGNLSTALEDLGDYNPPAGGDTGGTGGNGGSGQGANTGAPTEQLVTPGGGVVEMGGGTVQGVPSGQVPQQLADALGDNVLNGVPTDTGSTGNPNEQDVGPGGVVEMGGGTVQNIAPNMVPLPLKNALNDDTLQSVPTGN